AGFGVLVYQLLIYPFLAKYAGLVKPFRSAAVLSILLLATYPFMANLYGVELKVLINIASLLKNMFAVCPFSGRNKLLAYYYLYCFV
uniref:Uncharacterized protein n=1 Tax=Aegilops tauschii subsp. strangulata TaxID=200361 RepID=A0A453ERT0_AEGTS